MSHSFSLHLSTLLHLVPSEKGRTVVASHTCSILSSNKTYFHAHAQHTCHTAHAARTALARSSQQRRGGQALMAWRTIKRWEEKEGRTGASTRRDLQWKHIHICHRFLLPHRTPATHTHLRTPLPRTRTAALYTRRTHTHHTHTHAPPHTPHAHHTAHTPHTRIPACLPFTLLLHTCCCLACFTTCFLLPPPATPYTFACLSCCLCCHAYHFLHTPRTLLHCTLPALCHLPCLPARARLPLLHALPHCLHARHYRACLCLAYIPPPGAAALHLPALLSACAPLPPPAHPAPSLPIHSVHTYYTHIYRYYLPLLALPLHTTCLYCSSHCLIPSSLPYLFACIQR